MNYLSLKLAAYDITFEWISGACNKAADCLSRLIEVPEDNAPATSILINTVTASPVDECTTHTWNKPKPSVEVPPSDASKVNVPPLVTGDCRDTLLQMQQTDLFWKCFSKWLINGKVHHHESDTFTNIDGLLCKHTMDAFQKCLALVIPKSWCFTALLKAHDKLGHEDLPPY